jgi:hypothetical protein
MALGFNLRVQISYDSDADVIPNAGNGNPESSSGYVVYADQADAGVYVATLNSKAGYNLSVR